MANSQIFPASPYPGAGDILTTPGSPLTTVQGIQHIPVDPATPQPQQLLVMGSDGVWHPEDPVVSGPDAIGTTSSKPPVQVGGIDDGSLVREFRTDSWGGIELSAYDRNLLEQIVQQLRALTAAVVNLDNTAVDGDYRPDNFTDEKAGT